MTGDGDDFLLWQLESMAPHRALLRAVECRFMSEVPLNVPVLDIGSGDGHFASIAYSGQIDIGIDPLAKDMHEAASLDPAPYRGLVLGSATTLPFADASFATVVSNSVIEHIEDIDAVIAEISRVLKPGGTFAVTLPSEHYPEFLLGSTVARTIGSERLSDAYGAFFNRISHHYHIDPPDVWRERFESVGLHVDHHVYYFSPEAHRAFDLAHYLGVPNLLTKRILGRWVVHPGQAKLFEKWYRRFYDEGPQDRGAYQFVRCVKR